MLSKLLPTLPFSKPNSTLKEPSNTNRSPSKVSEFGRKLKKAFTRSRPDKKKPQCLKDLISAPVQLVHASTAVTRSGMQAQREDPLAFENPRSFQYSSPLKPNQHLAAPDTKTPGRSPPTQPLAEPRPYKWLGEQKQRRPSWSTPGIQNPVSASLLPTAPEETPSSPNLADPEQYSGSQQAPKNPTVPSWISEWESDEARRRYRYSATPEDLAKLAKERVFKWEGLFPDSPEDYKREGKRARARGIQTWVNPTPNAMAKQEAPVRRSASAVNPIREKERAPKRRRPQNVRQP
ncbi:hypothetical protein M407DRAFT_215975 [Tulasnella calospora MUT 4182]|uniref:Uncharacterized protein n=1 Tax=Tulasnella calospora MUT 4182 TaxID=1051891 RepID=A0A0C3LDZ5_9AGAM|nr:hypothetical protein M407DRAFT_215975 [Tulasnella calospora MUT 4182]